MLRVIASKYLGLASKQTLPNSKSMLFPGSTRLCPAQGHSAQGLRGAPTLCSVSHAHWQELHLPGGQGPLLLVIKAPYGVAPALLVPSLPYKEDSDAGHGHDSCRK